MCNEKGFGTSNGSRAQAANMICKRSQDVVGDQGEVLFSVAVLHNSHMQILISLKSTLVVCFYLAARLTAGGLLIDANNTTRTLAVATPTPRRIRVLHRHVWVHSTMIPLQGA